MCCGCLLRQRLRPVHFAERRTPANFHGRPQFLARRAPLRSLVHSPFSQKQQYSRCRPPIKHASFSWTFALSVVVVVCGGLAFHRTSLDFWHPRPAHEPETVSPPVRELEELRQIMAEPLPTGYYGNLTKEQEQKLKEFWAELLKVFGVIKQDEGTGSPTSENGKPNQSPSDVAGTKTTKKRGFFSRMTSNDKAEDEPTNGSNSAGANATLKVSDTDDKYGQTKEYYDALASQSPEELRVAFWSMVKHDHPDTLLLRYLRARKWDIGKALAMLVSTLHWRSHSVHLDDDVMKNGDTGVHDACAKKDADDFLSLLKLGESFLHGRDNSGRPICYIRVRLHKVGAISQAALERYTVYLIETSRLLLESPIETAALVFDMTDFALANMDYPPVKFMIKCFEANYPECLGVVLVHKAPWVFSSIWTMIKGWLDPVVAAKVQFTKTTADLERYIPRNQIVKELGGGDDYEYNYIEPEQKENEKQQDTGTRDSLNDVRFQHAADFQQATLSWLASAAGEDKESGEKREELATMLRENYWLLDPFVRARSMYDRLGTIPPSKKSTAPMPGNGGRSLSEKHSGEVVMTKPIAVGEELD